ncbi:MAG: hypothetical protein ACJ8F7_04065 [Gemmataceae bacterium]
MSRKWVLGALLAVLNLAPAFAADKVPVVRTTDDRQIIDLLASIHNRGAELFNAGDQAGCYRLFEGSLVTIQLLLPTELNSLVEQGLAEAAREPGITQRALRLHKLIEDVRVKLHPTAGPAPTLLPLPRKKMTSDSEPEKAPGVATKPVEANPVKNPGPMAPAKINIGDPMPPAIQPKSTGAPPPVTAPTEEPPLGPIIIPVPDKKK